MNKIGRIFIFIFYLLFVISCTNNKTEKIIRSSSIELMKCDIESKFDGSILWISFNEGDTISLGDIICKISKFPLASSQNSHDSLNLKNYNDSIKIISTDGEIIAIKKKINVTEIENLDFIKLDDRLVISPWSGIITKKYVMPGTKVFIGSPIVSITDTTNIYSNLLLKSSEIGKLKVGMTLKGYIPSLSIKEEFRIMEITKNRTDAGWRSTGDNATVDNIDYLIHLVPLKNTIPEIREGMLVSFEITSNS